ncbi:MAG: flagellar hook-basal body complex protein FliE [Gemmatimonadaceae bacterium]
MSDPIGAIRGSIGAAQGGGVGGIGGSDAAKRYTFDIGKGDDAGAKGPSFGDTLTKAINQVSDAQDNSADMVQKFMRGEPVELHQVMAASEEAGIALEMMIELRNKFTEAYRTLISMQ